MKRKTYKAKIPAEPLFPENRKKIIYGLLLSAVLLSVIRFILLPVFLKPDKPVVLKQSEKEFIKQAVQITFNEFLLTKKRQTDRGDYIEVQIPRKLNFLHLYSSITQNLNNIKDSFVSCEETKNNIYVVRVGLKNITVCKYIFKPQAILGYVAIIIDDFGYVFNDLVKDYLRCRYPLTVSIIPGLQESRTIAREASLLSKEVLVHMPMEPLHAAYHDNGFMLLTNQNNSEIRMRIRRAFSLLPNAVGMNNHQGSKATADKQLMQVVLNELNHLDKFFVDSKTNNHSLGYELARTMSVHAAVNTLFIDARDEKDFMLGQLQRIIDLAVKGENVVAIAHVRRDTYQILMENMPKLEEKGIEFVYVSQLVN
ncbi:divergent polysaccharide deacetylase family protein [candidate division KSB1 bacterium]|nr:divergent polysaccharide deacetylase family protein [candidate division KSB1 bacterium]